MHNVTHGRTGRARSLKVGKDPLPLRPVPLATVCLLPFMLLALLLAPGAVQAMEIAVLPFANLSEDLAAQRAVMPAIREGLAEMGMALADEADVDRILFRRRVRDTAYVSADVAKELGDTLGVEAVFLGCIVGFSQEDSLEIGLTARLVDTRSGRILWAGFASAKGTDFAGLLGLGEVKTMEGLVPKAVERLLDSFSAGPPVQREQTYRIAVMPFKNNTEAFDAGIKATYMSLVRLSRSRIFEPLEYGEVRAAMVRSRIEKKGGLDYKTLEALSRELKADGILLGTLESYPERPSPTVPPEVEMTVRLLDAKEKRLLWYDSLLGVGKKRIIFNTWDPVKPADETAYEVISKLMKRMEKLKWR